MKLGILTDIHEDIISLRAAIQLFEKKGCNELICLGDITGFEVPYYSYRSSRSASDCLSLIRSNCSIIILGNHDLFSVREIPNHKAGFKYPSQWYDLDFIERKILANNTIWLYEPDTLSPLLGKKELEFLASLPEYAIMEADGHRILFSHSLFPDPTGSIIWAPQDLESFRKHFKMMKDNQCDTGFSGHFHPNGYMRSIEDDFEVKGFGKAKWEGPRTQIICPCTAQADQANGVCIFDTRKNEIEVIPIKNKNTLQKNRNEKN